MTGAALTAIRANTAAIIELNFMISRRYQKYLEKKLFSFEDLLELLYYRNWGIKSSLYVLGASVKVIGLILQHKPCLANLTVTSQ